MIKATEHPETCFWCGSRPPETACLAHGVPASYRARTQCKAQWRAGVHVIEAAGVPSFSGQTEMIRGIYPTGRWGVITAATATRLFGPKFKAPRTLLNSALFQYLIIDAQPSETLH
jgi:hypothetical protein